MFWKRDNIEKNLGRIDWLIKKSFINVKRDVSGIFQWLNYFYAKSNEQEKKLNQIKSEIYGMPKNKEEVIRIINEQYQIDNLLKKISELSHRIDEFTKSRFESEAFSRGQQTRKEQSPDISEIEKRLEKLEQKKMAIKEKIMKKLTKNSKEYIKSIIMSYIKKYEKVTAIQLREMIVDEQGICSRSSFYRLLSEIEDSEDLGFMKHGKEKHYLAKGLKRL